MIVGLTGKKRSGKTEASKGLWDEFDTLNFKDPLITEIRKNMPDLLKQIQLESSSGKSLMTIDELFDTKPPLLRKLMQNYGTDLRRNEDEDYWVKKWLERVKDYSGNVVVDDVRFLNEASAIKMMGGIVVRITREGEDDSDNHKSEKEMDLIAVDHEIVNDGTKEELQELLYKIYQIDVQKD